MKNVSSSSFCHKNLLTKLKLFNGYILHHCVNRGQRSILFELLKIKLCCKGINNLTRCVPSLSMQISSFQKMKTCRLFSRRSRDSFIPIAITLLYLHKKRECLSMTTFYFAFMSDVLLLCTPCRLLSTTVHLYDILYSMSCD